MTDPPRNRRYPIFVRHFTRRAFLQAAAVSPLLAESPATLSSDEDRFLDDISRRAFRYFWEQADPHTGLVLDRARMDGLPRKDRAADVASMASTGFALTALCIAYRRKWMDPQALRGRIETTLRHLAYEQPHYLGWFYHFVNRKTGERVWECELSTIDTAILLAGIITAQQCFIEDTDIASLAQDIFDRVDFLWMLDPQTQLMHMGWKPVGGFLRSVWGNYRENILLSIIGMSSPTHPLPIHSWYRFRRDSITFDNYSFVGRGPLFTHQFPQAWLSLEGLRDGSPFHLDYFVNSVIATRAHRAYCLSLRSLYPSFSPNLWGVTASDSAIGYVIWGAMTSRRNLDGTIVPCAAAGSLMFTPDICLPALRTMYDEFGDLIYGPYGFADSFNPETRWVDSEVLGIDQGITLLSAENLRTQSVWKWFMSSPDIRRAIGRVFEPAERPA
jgi:hypothetical protein